MPRKRNDYKSKLERDVATAYPQLVYEPDKIKYIIPSSQHTYNPDWKVRKDVYIETKGKFTAVDRKKMLLVKEQNPHLTIYLLFQNAKNKLDKRSKTTYAMWAEKHGFQWAEWNGTIPEEWLCK